MLLLVAIARSDRITALRIRILQPPSGMEPNWGAANESSMLIRNCIRKSALQNLCSAWSFFSILETF